MRVNRCMACKPLLTCHLSFVLFFFPAAVIGANRDSCFEVETNVVWCGVGVFCLFPAMGQNEGQTVGQTDRQTDSQSQVCLFVFVLLVARKCCLLQHNIGVKK